MVNRNIYTSVFIIGFVFGILSLVVGQPPEVALTLFFLTFVALLLIKFIDEWRYYRSHNAPLASATFLVVPTLVGVGGSFLAHLVSFGKNDLLQTSLLEVFLDLSLLNIGRMQIFWNLFGLIVVVPSVGAILVLLRRYYLGHYPIIFIFRRRFPNETVIIFNFTLVVIFLLYWIETGLVELGGLAFCILSLGLFVQHYILKIVLVPLKRVPRRQETSSRTIQSRSSIINQPSPRGRLTQIRRSQTSPNASPLTPSIRPRSARGTLGDIRVTPGYQVEIARQAHPKVTQATLAKLVPVGRNLDEDDFRCIFCYEFPTEPHRTVMICPHCRYPSHANEFQKWIDVTRSCSRCNKPLSPSSVIRLSGGKYAKVIKLYKNGQ